MVLSFVVSLHDPAWTANARDTCRSPQYCDASHTTNQRLRMQEKPPQNFYGGHCGND